MAKDLVEYNGKKGIWRTVSGRKIFIAEGEDLKTAMAKSGKFKGAKSNTKSSIDKDKKDNIAKTDKESSKQTKETPKKDIKKTLAKQQADKKAAKEQPKEYDGEGGGLSERDARDLITELNDEGSDFTFDDRFATIEDGKLKTTVSVFMPDDRGYTTRELEVPLSENETYDTLSEKLRDWQERHNSPDSFYDEDFKRLKDQNDYTKPSQEDSIARQRMINDLRGKVSTEEYLNTLDQMTKRNVSNDEIKQKLAKQQAIRVSNIKTQKSLKELVEDGKAQDITNYDDAKTRALDEKHGRLEPVKVTKGVYGMNGALLRSRKTGQYFVITARNGNLFYWV